MNDIAQQPNAPRAAKQAELQQLHAMSTPALMKQAVSELRLLAKAEILHARLELQEELRAAKSAAILLGCTAALALCGLGVVFVGIALALPLVEWVAAFVVGGILLALAGVCAGLGYRQLPKKPLGKTQQRLKDDVSITREQFA